jgi:hypothetical protein
VQVIPVSARPGVYSGDVETALSVAQQALLSDPQRLTVTVAGDPEFDAPSAVLLTEQTAAEIGPFAYTVLVQDASGSLGFLGHEYPMTPEALMTIRDHWQQRAARLGAGFQIERPERAVVSGEPARLMPWLEYGGQA